MIRAPLIAVLALASALSAQAVSAEPEPQTRDPAKAPAGHYELDRRHVSLIARVSHLGLSDYTLRLDRLDGHFDYDPAHPEASQVVASVDPASLDVGDAGISRQFAGQFLGTDEAPQITFTSTAIQLTDPTHGTVTGDLNFHGVTRPVTLAVTFDGYGASLIGGQRLGFSAVADIRRSDFGSTAFLNEVGDTVHLVIEAEFTRQ